MLPFILYFLSTALIAGASSALSCLLTNAICFALFV
jgi:hypothetical protein